MITSYRNFPVPFLLQTRQSAFLRAVNSVAPGQGPDVRIYFSEFFGVSPEVVADYGAFDIACVVDLPLFIDPFLLFTSKKPTYQALHDEIINYLRFLRDKAVAGGITPGLPTLLRRR